MNVEDRDRDRREQRGTERLYGEMQRRVGLMSLGRIKYAPHEWETSPSRSQVHAIHFGIEVSNSLVPVIGLYCPA